MLVNVHINNLAIIDEADVDFGPDLNILTGETGAGKSVLLGAVNIALGAKVSPDMIRKGADFALVELTFQVDSEEQLKKLELLDIPVEEGVVIIQRRIKNGRSICKVNDISVTMNTLKNIALLLIDIHSQHEHQTLLQTSRHLEIVDRFGKAEQAQLLGDLKEEFLSYKKYKDLLSNQEEPEDKRARELSFLEYEKDEIEKANIKEGEEEELTAVYNRLSNAGQIAEDMQQVHQWMSEGMGSVEDNVGRSARTLAKVFELDADTENIYNLITQIEDMVNDFNRSVSSYMGELSFEPEELDEVVRRLDLIHNLQSKYGDSVDEINAYYQEVCNKIERYANYDAYIEEVKGKYEAAAKKVEKYATQLSDIRKKNAKQLEVQIIEALKDLNFPEVRFEIVFTKLAAPTVLGVDQVEFMISTNPGEDLKPLTKIASGGELSRVMLALKSVLADKDDVDTLIFDEIDTGISGRTAQKVSEKLASIGSMHQVIAISHLPQIAAMADQHYVIEKTTDGTSTVTNIRELSSEESVEELSRMLGGAKITAAVEASAKEMLELARETKKNYR
ncbi:MAG: DNA repair protein RecN [Lachnospiraceae bacterium]|nr:DNA repair protein RecN [Lachnospiraceae bacterium]